MAGFLSMAHPAITLSGIAGNDPVSFLLLMCGRRVWPFFFFLPAFSPPFGFL
jgi:hypothetical protein